LYIYVLFGSLCQRVICFEYVFIYTCIIKVNNWPFCAGESGTPCSGDVGVALDIDITISGTSSAVNTKGSTFSGLTPSSGDAALVLSTEVLSDESWVEMEEGYPLVTSSGSSSESFTFRFASFTSSSMYDPVITFADLSPTLSPTKGHSGAGDSDSSSFFSSTHVQMAGGAIIGGVVLIGLGFLGYSRALKRGSKDISVKQSDQIELA
jgi:hypothetical protein